MVAMVTGAGSGIGMACVAKLLVRDFVVIGWVRNKVGEEKLLANLALKNIRVHKLYIVYADFMDNNQVQEGIGECKEILSKFGDSLDVFINCAGVYSSLNFKGSSGNEIHMMVNFLTPKKLIETFSPYLNKREGARVVCLVPNITKHSNCFGKQHVNVKRAYYNSKFCLALFLHELAKRGQNYNIYMFMPRPSTTDFYTKNTAGLHLQLGLLRKMFSLPPEYSAEHAVLIATRPEFAEESGGLYRELSLIPLPKFMYNKKLIEKFNSLAPQTIPIA